MFWPDVLVFLMSLVLLLPLQLDGDHTSFGGQSGQLFGRAHDVRGFDRDADHPSLASCHSGLGQEHHLLEIDIMSYQLILQLGEPRPVVVVELEPVRNCHRRHVALLERALAGGAKKSEVADRLEQVVVPSFVGINLKRDFLLQL